jgi:hypothetical protein
MAFGAETRMEIERARISMMARNATVPLTGRIQKRKTNQSPDRHFRLATRGRSIQMGQEPRSARLSDHLVGKCRSQARSTARRLRSASEQWARAPS